ncbi:NAD(P)/FAD-dependent oxidoreductase [Roseisalinus antarcticus]|uniref:Hydrogen cyanide synthase subunit HcnC n=1 Tax=Roseisalinus antarcticus TaxID=254357 RepID=A0A1Y5SNG4_9RHOB|nr:FAD-dependent oxidoreductase [Roseisalinus antarcticus]SLN44161.1 Hydrogen cyanide synthase subunit HcnC precursor [Roseisalinus antarcticus]
MATADVTIRGAGVFGLSVAYACARRGAAVQVIDPHGPAAGASGGVVGALAPHVPEQWNDKKAFQLESLLMAAGFWADVTALSGLDPGYARSGRVQPLADAEAAGLARRRVVGAADLWRGEASWEVTEDSGGWRVESPTGLFVRDTLSARIHPRQATLALAGAVTALGGRICREGADRGKVVWATGWQGLMALSDELGRVAGNGVKGQAAVLRHAACHLPQVFVDGIHVVPHGDGTVAVGSTSEREFDRPDTVDEQLDVILKHVRAAVPELADAEVLGRWAGVRPRARSRAPILGGWPGRTGHFIANGGFKIGFGMAPLVGEVMADLVFEGRDRIPAPFRVSASL